MQAFSVHKTVYRDGHKRKYLPELNKHIYKKVSFLSLFCPINYASSKHTMHFNFRCQIKAPYRVFLISALVVTYCQGMGWDGGQRDQGHGVFPKDQGE